MNLLHRIFSVADKLAWLLGAAGVAALVVMVLAISADVFMRYVFNNPIDGVRDMQQLFNAVIVSAMLPVLIRYEGNITVNFIDYVKNEKFLKVIRVVAHIAGFVVLVLLTWRLWSYSSYLAVTGERTITLLKPVAPWWRLSSIFVGYATLMCLYDIFYTLVPPPAGQSSAPPPKAEQGGE